ncbi:MAG: hypothetical protein ACLVJ4_03675 [Mediterraneibacter sp.]
MIPQFQISTETGAADKKCGEASLRLLAQAGFTCVDYSPAMNGYQAFKGLYTFSDSDFKSFFVREKERAQNAGVQIGQIHAPYNPPPDTLTGEELAFFVRAVKRAIYACHLLGSPYVVIHRLFSRLAGGAGPFLRNECPTAESICRNCRAIPGSLSG